MKFIYYIIIIKFLNINIENSKGQFGNLLLNSIDLSHTSINNDITEQTLVIMAISGLVITYMCFIIFKSIFCLLLLVKLYHKLNHFI